MGKPTPHRPANPAQPPMSGKQSIGARSPITSKKTLGDAANLVEANDPIRMDFARIKELLPVGTGSTCRIIRREISSQQQRKMNALVRHYGIDPASIHGWKRLAKRIARDFVAGFQVADKPVKRGRPPVEPTFEFRIEVFKVESLMQQKGMSARAAYASLQTKTINTKTREREINAWCERYRRYLNDYFQTTPEQVQCRLSTASGSARNRFPRSKRKRENTRI